MKGRDLNLAAASWPPTEYGTVNETCVRLDETRSVHRPRDTFYYRTLAVLYFAYHLPVRSNKREMY